MLDLVNKSSSIYTNDQEYNKMKERILIINNDSLPDNIFYLQRFNVNNFFFFSDNFLILLDM